jgi:hypothetical protein
MYFENIISNNLDDYKYINLNNSSAVSSHLASYILSRSGVFFKTDDENSAALFSHINNDRILSTDEFLERVFAIIKENV